MGPETDDKMGEEVNWCAADLETTTDPSCLRAHMCGAVLGDGTNLLLASGPSCLEDFFIWVEQHKVRECWIHNLRFDLPYFLEYLYETGECSPERTKILKAADGMVYSCSVEFEREIKVGGSMQKHVLTFKDSWKKISSSIEKIAKELMGIEKYPDFDYTRHDEDGIPYTDEEYRYLHQDVETVRFFISELKKAGRNRLTKGADSLLSFLTGYGYKRFRAMYPLLTYEEYNEYVTSYMGGLCCLNPRWKDKIIDERVFVIDASSMYPYWFSKMSHVHGKPQRQKPIFPSIELVRVKGYLLFPDGACPCLLPHRKGRIGGMRVDKTETDHQKASEFLQRVDLSDRCWWFRFELEELGRHGQLVIDVVDHAWLEAEFDPDIAEFFVSGYNNKNIHEGLQSEIDKYNINTTTGKYAKKAVFEGRGVQYEEHCLSFPLLEPEIPADTDLVGEYFLLTAQCNALARTWLRTIIRVLGPDFIYCDTDSIHGILRDDTWDKLKNLGLILFKKPKKEWLPADLECRPARLGNWELQGIYDQSRYICAKRYGHIDTRGEIEIKCAGMPADLARTVPDLEAFAPGTVWGPKKCMKVNTRGLSYIAETTFTLTEETPSYR